MGVAMAEVAAHSSLLTRSFFMDGGITEIFPGITQLGMQSPVQALFQPASLRRLHQTE